ncbi:hypothetical protein V1478_018386 [Vespula squamosa]|uniref:LAGLIDADG homing endonuclease n=1 Tax=Vespula squamosa TaxID=30214 RepID=A0ABD1ZUV9_VESSQ
MDLRLLRIPELLYKFSLAGTFSESGSKNKNRSCTRGQRIEGYWFDDIAGAVPWKLLILLLRRSNTGGTNNEVIHQLEIFATDRQPIGFVLLLNRENLVYIRFRLKLIDRSAFATYRRYVPAMSGLSEPVELEAGTAPI